MLLAHLTLERKAHPTGSGEHRVGRRRGIRRALARSLPGGRQRLEHDYDYEDDGARLGARQTPLHSGRAHWLCSLHLHDSVLVLVCSNLIMHVSELACLLCTDHKQMKEAREKCSLCLDKALKHLIVAMGQKVAHEPPTCAHLRSELTQQ